MRTFILTTFVLIAPALFALEGRGRLKGIVTEEGSNRPVSFARVSVLGRDSVVAFADTDAKGAYFMEHLPKGTFRVEVKAGGYLTAVSEEVKIQNGFTTELDFALVVRPPASVPDAPSTSQAPRVDLMSVPLDREALLMAGMDLESAGRRRSTATVLGFAGLVAGALLTVAVSSEDDSGLVIGGGVGAAGLLASTALHLSAASMERRAGRRIQKAARY